MIARHTLTYVGSRTVAAALNMAALAAFTRLAPVETYGTYLLIFSWAVVLYGATCQWPKFAFFALYEEDRALAQIGTLVRLLCCTLALAASIAATTSFIGLADPYVALAIVAAVAGITAFEGTVEVARTRLAAEAVGTSVVVRGVLILAGGSLTLWLTGDPVDLVLAFAGANLLAAVPAGRTVWPLATQSHGSLAEAKHLIAYGWPLVFSFGLAALAQSIDKLIIGKTIGAQELGAYGAISDFLRQSFIVFGEGIALSMISIAKRDAREGDIAQARLVLREAACSLTVIAAFGCVFFLTFDEIVFAVLLGPSYRGTALSLAPILIAASICVMFRAYYFGQVIYFTRSSMIEAVASGTMLMIVGGLSLALIPEYGLKGAAIALALGQGLSCLVFVLGARGSIRMPIPIADIVLIVFCALGTWAALSAVGLVLPAEKPLGIAIKLVLLARGAGAAVWHFNIAGIADGLTGRSRRPA